MSLIFNRVFLSMDSSLMHWLLDVVSVALSSKTTSEYGPAPGTHRATNRTRHRLKWVERFGASML